MASTREIPAKPPAQEARPATETGHRPETDSRPLPTRYDGMAKAPVTFSDWASI